MKRVAIYIRVSTSKQDTDNQRRELEAVAQRSGWKVVKVYEDAGISGAKGRDQRPGLDAMMKAVNAKEFDMVASWSVDRLGRSLTDLLGHPPGLHEKGSRSVPSPARSRYLDDRRQCFGCWVYLLSSRGES
jgi:DNA invertase Pin-like site-specific DNA recombinase